MRAMNDDPAPADVASETPTSAATESATAAAARQFPQPKKFRVEVLSARAEEVDSTNMFGRKPDRRPKVVKRAAGKAALALQKYLNRVFVLPDSRFSRGPLRGFLTDNARAALDDRDRRALGADGPAIVGGTTISAKARAVVIYDGNRPFAVTLRYAAKMSIIQRDTPDRLTQSGTIVLRQVNKAWRADLVDVKLSLPDRRSARSGNQSQEGTS